MEHKIAAYKHHIARMKLLPKTPNRKQAQWYLVYLITQNNKFPQKHIQTLKQQQKRISQ